MSLLQETNGRVQMSDLPDLCLLEVFDHLPLLDLFNRISLVCTRWTTLQSVALNRRTRLILINEEVDEAFLRNMGSMEMEMDKLPLPSTYQAWDTPSARRLLQPESRLWLWKRLPNITQLRIHINFHQTTRAEDQRLRATIEQQAIRLASGTVRAGQGWCRQLTTLHLTLGSIQEPISHEPLVDANGLIKAINHRMPRLSVLQFRTYSAKPVSVLLTDEALARLRYLVVDIDHTIWLWRSLCSVGRQNNLVQLRPDLSIEMHCGDDIRHLMELAANTSTKPFQQVRKLQLMAPTLDEQLKLALHLIPDRLQGLRSLEFVLSDNAFLDLQPDFPNRRCPWLVLGTVMRCLSPLTSLQSLKLMEFNLVPIDGESIEEEEDRRLRSNPTVLPSLETLVLYSCPIFSHTDLGNALDWPCWLPRLRSLTLYDYRCSTHCQSCHRYEDNTKFFPVNSECLRLAVEPLQLCPQLSEISMNQEPAENIFSVSLKATRSNMSAPFRWTARK